MAAGALVAMALLALVPSIQVLAGTVIRFVTNKGELVIQTDDPKLEVTIKNGVVLIHDKVKDRRFVLTAGDYDVTVREEGKDSLRFFTRRFTVDPRRQGDVRRTAGIGQSQLNKARRRGAHGSTWQARTSRSARGWS